jgi:hypothetical protein
MRLVGVSHLVEVLLGTQYLLPQCGALVFLLEGRTTRRPPRTHPALPQKSKPTPPEAAELTCLVAWSTALSAHRRDPDAGQRSRKTQRLDLRGH